LGYNGCCTMVDRNPLLSVAFTLPIKEKPPNYTGCAAGG